MVHVISLFWGGKRTRIRKRYRNIDLEEMMEARVHLGHKTRKWNPKVAPYIFMECGDTHIIDLAKTTGSSSEACDLSFDMEGRGKQFLTGSTKYQAVDLVASAAIESRCHYVNRKWLGGILTNWSTMEMRPHRFKDLKKEQDMG